MAGSLDVQSIPNQVEAIYIAYFNRAADGNGQLYWVNQFNVDVNVDNLSVDQAASMISNSFAVQPEAKATFAFLNSPPVTLNPADPTQVAAADNLVITAYHNLFGRTVTGADSGVTYWVGQILTGQVAVGSAIYAIANGATAGGADATVLADKIAAATTFTNDTFAANLGGVDPATGQLTPSFATAANSSVAPVVDATTLAASQAATEAFVTTSSTPTLPPLTPGIDNVSTAASHAVFNAPLVTLPPSEGGNISGGSSTNLQTLTVGDTLTDTNTAGDGTLNATLAATSNGTNHIVQNVTMSGISAANVSVVTDVAQGFQGNITGLTTVNDANSSAGLALGVLGAGLNTALVNVNITGYTGFNGSTVFSGVLTQKAGSATNIINVSLSGLLGDTGFGLADKLFFGTDGPFGTKASPSISYGVWGITANSNANLQLEQNGVGDAAVLAVLGAGSVALGQDAVGNWQNLTTIDASLSTGNVTITGHSADTLFVGNGNAQNSNANPGGLFGSAVGLLDGNTSLTLYKLSTGVNFLDVSSESTPTMLAGLKTEAGTNAQTDNTIVVSSADADTTSSATFANIAGFQILGVTTPGADTGTINVTNLPSTIDEILYQTTSGGNLTINNAPATLFTVDTEANGVFFDTLTINAPAAGSVHVIVGSTTVPNGLGTAGLPGEIGAVTMTGEQTVDFTVQGGSAALGSDFIGSVLLTPASLAGSMNVTIDGSSPADFGFSGSGAFADLVFGITTPTLNVDNLQIVISDTKAVTFEAADTGPLAATILGNTFAIPYSTNAESLDAHASGGLIMEAGDANFLATATSSGNLITGSQTAGNVLIGSIGNDTITGTLSTTAPDTIATGGGKDAITLAGGHTASDHVELFAGSQFDAAPGQATTGAFGSIVDPADHAQLGWWGIPTNGTNTPVVGPAAPPALFLDGGGTSADMSTVAGFQAGSATKPQDVVDVSLDAFSGFLHDIGTGGFIPFPGPPLPGQLLGFTPATFSTPLDLGNFVTPLPVGSANVLVLSTPISGATALAADLAVPATALYFAAGTTALTEHFILAYQDLSNNTRIADVDLHAPVGSHSTDAGEVAVSDMVQLSGGISQLHAGNIHFVV